MAGGATTTELVAAACKTGALGFLGPIGLRVSPEGPLSVIHSLS
jgi:NAD(P)H-dependent flavin oxidoreductase YrpB (nitropropane dioxygenase family)